MPHSLGITQQQMMMWKHAKLYCKTPQQQETNGQGKNIKGEEKENQ